NVYGFVLAMALAAGWSYDRWWRRSEVQPIAWREIAAGLALLAGGAIAGIVQMAPPPETRIPGWRFAWEPIAAIRPAMMGWRALVPVPRLDLHFWNSNVLDPWPALEVAAGVLMLLLGLALLWRSRVAVVTF